MKIYYAVVFAALFAPAAYALDIAPKPEAVTCDTKAIVHVEPIACDTCARTLEKLFLKRSDVTEIDVDIEAYSAITVYSGPGLAAPDEDLIRIIGDSGYLVTFIERVDC